MCCFHSLISGFGRKEPIHPLLRSFHLCYRFDPGHACFRAERGNGTVVSFYLEGYAGEEQDMIGGIMLSGSF